jgi:hypothetical protein
MNVDQANKIILKPHITEKTFAMVENENKICFIVKREASKPQIAEAVDTLQFMARKPLFNLRQQQKLEIWLQR